MTDILNCPMCGSIAKLDKHENVRWAIVCVNKDCGIGTSYEYSKKDARSRWNKRINQEIIKETE